MQSVEKVLSSKPSKKDSQKYEEFKIASKKISEQTFWAAVIVGFGVFAYEFHFIEFVRHYPEGVAGTLSFVGFVVAIYKGTKR